MGKTIDRIMEFRRFDGEMVHANIKGELIASYHDAVFWTMSGKRHAVRYCLQVKTFSDGVEAAKEFGLCVRHAAECDGLFE